MPRQSADVSMLHGRWPLRRSAKCSDSDVICLSEARCRGVDSSRCIRFMVAIVISMVVTPSTLDRGSFASAFSIRMDYKPPVQTSVSKLLRSQRIPPKKDWKESESAMSSSSSSPPRGSTLKNAAAAGALMAPLETTSLMPTPESFERRMRDLVFRNREKRSESNSYVQNQRTNNNSLPSNLHVIETLQDYKMVVGEERTKVVAVRFYAPWCKACKAVAPLYYHLANKYSDVIFVDVPVTERNTNLHQGLGVPTLPFAHMYHPVGGLVEELRLSRKFIPQFEHKLQSYVTGRCEVIDDDLGSPYTVDQESPSSTDTLR